MPNHSPDHMRRITGASAAKRRATKLARLIETSPPLHREQVAQLCAALLDVQVDEEAARMSREQSNAAATTKPPRQPAGRCSAPFPALGVFHRRSACH